MAGATQSTTTSQTHGESSQADVPTSSTQEPAKSIPTSFSASSSVSSKAPAPCIFNVVVDDRSYYLPFPSQPLKASFSMAW
ncbi:hypothetical protein CC78DRAFT_536162 [Lojkania enalia]|uniref:Uncharacterized protein n=1 Tax=Lojkania enalia TaxID=147567 RepID=A0A9P4N3H6_9PLEO|nr:hypothetical protein CC78DRAFT_536162 [Didymosphaeria enalia]